MTLEEILSNAVSSHATDVHIEHSSLGVTIYQRNFGLLRRIANLSQSNNLINRVKMRSNLDLSETRRTQEGQFLCEERNRQTFI